VGPFGSAHKGDGEQDMSHLASAWELPCGDAEDGDRLRHALRHAGAGTDNGILPNLNGRFLGAIKYDSTCSDVCAAADVNHTGNVDSWRERAKVLDNHVVANCAIKVDLNMPAQADICRYYASCAHDGSDADFNEW